MDAGMAGVVLKRKSFMVEEAKVRRLLRTLGARSESEAIRIAIDRELALTTGLDALRRLRKWGTLEDVFGRLKRNPK